MSKGDLIRTEWLIALWSLLPTLAYLAKDGWGTALAVYACCIGVPQPFLLVPYYWERRRRRRRNRRL